MGRSQDTTTTMTDRLDPARSAALWAALGCDGAPPGPGDRMPGFFHQIYFWTALPPSALGRDGHPAPGVLLPETGLPRRMWAGGRLTFHAPLLLGVQATRTSRVVSTTRKSGKTGALAFVTVRHQIMQRGSLAVSEDQDIVYRPDGAPKSEPVAAPQGALQREVRGFDPVLLFRYSALTHNGHRIHYDADYARDVEGYGGLVIHGPLLAQLLVLMAERHLGPLATFAFRARAPLCLPERATFDGAGQRLWVAGEDGRLCMEAEATPA